MDKKIAAMLCVAFALGIVVGRLNRPALSKKVTTTESIEKTHSISDVQTSIQDKKDSTTVKQTIRSELHYYANGKLKSKIVIGTNEGSKASTDTSLTSHETVAKTTQTDVKTKTVDEYRPNWMLGINSKTSSFVNPKLENFDAVLGYRILGSVYVTASTNATLKDAHVGVMLEL